MEGLDPSEVIQGKDITITITFSRRNKMALSKKDILRKRTDVAKVKKGRENKGGKKVELFGLDKD